jgi:hypothetical protein
MSNHCVSFPSQWAGSDEDLQEGNDFLEKKGEGETGGVTQMIECLLSNPEALNSNSTAKKNFIKQGEGEKKGRKGSKVRRRKGREGRKRGRKERERKKGRKEGREGGSEGRKEE